MSDNLQKFLQIKDSQKGTNEYGPSIKYPDNTERDILTSLSENNSEQQQTNHTQEQESLQEDSKVDQTGHLPSSNEKSRERSKIVFIVIGMLLLAGIIIGSLRSYYFSSSPLRELKALGIITSGADVNKADEDGNTPLYWAVIAGRTEIVEMLIAAGADVNKANKHGWTPLNWAAMDGHTEIVKMLIDAGTDVNKADEDGKTPLNWAVIAGHTEIVKMLIAAGADVNKADEDGKTPLHSAANRNTEIVKMLIAAGANVNKADKHGWTPLEASWNVEIIELLKQAGAK